MEDEEESFDEFINDIDKFKKFSGAIIVDDPLKPDDAKSETKRKAVNDRYNNTIQSRTNGKNTPIIYIMQRLHEDDPSGFLLGGGSEENWYHLKIPAIVNNKALCEDKHSLEMLRKLEKADPYMFAGQYLQEPAPLEGGLIKREWFEIVSIVPDIVKDMYIDGAFTKDTANDPTGIDVIGYDKKTDTIYVFNALDEYMELPGVLDVVPKHAEQFNMDRRSTIRIEPKASGQALRPMLIKDTKLNATEIKGKQVQAGKIGRVEACSPTMRAGKIKLVKGSWNSTYLHQLSTFPNAKHDEHVDNLCYAICDYMGIYNHKSQQISYGTKVI
jgi:predicted phage terminase large subunit-like protein